MRVARLEREDDFDGWRAAVRTLAHEGVAAADVVWQVGPAAYDLFGAEPVTASDAPLFNVKPPLTPPLSESAVKMENAPLLLESP